MKQTGVKVLLTGGHWIAAVLPADTVQSLVSSWMAKRLPEFYSVTCQMTGMTAAFRVVDVLGIHTFDPNAAQPQQPQQPGRGQNWRSN